MENPATTLSKLDSCGLRLKEHSRFFLWQVKGSPQRLRLVNKRVWLDSVHWLPGLFPGTSWKLNMKWAPEGREWKWGSDESPRCVKQSRLLSEPGWVQSGRLGHSNPASWTGVCVCVFSGAYSDWTPSIYCEFSSSFQFSLLMQFRAWDFDSYVPARHLALCWAFASKQCSLSLPSWCWRTDVK